MQVTPIRRTSENLKYIPKIGNFFTPVNVAYCFVKSASVNENNSSPPALAYVYSPESEEPAASSNSGPDSAASATIEGSGDGGTLVLPPTEPLVESRSSPCISTPILPGDPALWGAITERFREEAFYRGPAAFQNRAAKLWKQIVTIFQMKKHFQKCFFILRMWLHCLTHK
ncbi:hypothetical protein CHARACLAT_009590 [Characodon lateralis]|uniref:Uncharacterized protein n=1 Tax=Characodon lateralis TaxID=208331 RepID=A0ABU7ELE0_9TELE|nr:hypothetical protein [Characodon lateralis]